MRIPRDEWGLQVASVTAQRGTCFRRQVGCVLMSADGRILATGYNGRARGLPHCDAVVREPVFDPERRVYRFRGTPREESWTVQDCTGFVDTFPHACAGALAPSGTALDACEAIHAEQNAIINCPDAREVDTCYVTVSPCVHCVKMLMNTGCRRIVFRSPYTHEEASRTLWEGAGHEWVLLKNEGIGDE